MGKVDISSNNFNFFGYLISKRGVIGDVDETLKLIASGKKGSYMACANPHSIVIASRDSVFDLALKNADILLPDGIGVVMAAKLFNKTVVRKVAGYDYFIELSLRANLIKGLRYFFLGSSNNVLERIKSRLNREYPTIIVSGTYSPPFKEVFSKSDNKAMIKAVNDAKPDILWVGMTAPKQEKWIYENRDKLHVPFIGAIGAVFDYYAGIKVRPSTFWQNLGLEWLPRFIKEPERLWERNMTSTPIFISWLLKEKLRQLRKR